MQKKHILLAKESLKLLEKKDLGRIKISSILKNHTNTGIKNKTQLLENINSFFDFLLKKNLSSLESSSQKDMLFEIIMARLDILNSYRESVKNIINYLRSRPHEFIKIIPSFVNSMILIATLSNIKANGIKGAAKIKGIFFLYLLIVYTWSKDETASLEKTMTTLDKYLSNIEKYLDIL